MVKTYFKKNKRIRKYNNMIEATYLTSKLKMISGLSVFTLECTPQNRAICKFSFVGLFFFFFWAFVFLYCAVKAFVEDQTILRNLYSTKLRYYGDALERVASTIYVLFSMWYVAFKLSADTKHSQTIIDIDEAIETLGVPINFSKFGIISLSISLCQLAISTTRVLSVGITLASLKMAMPVEIMFQAVVCDSLALVNTSHYCFFLNVLKQRYKIINGLLAEIKGRKSWQQLMIVRDKQPANMQRALNLQHKYICEKIRACAKIYSMLFKAIENANNTFGFAIVLTMLVCLLYIILYLFYFMEATASGLFHNVQRYSYFLIIVGWQISYSIGVIILNIFFAERAVDEALIASYVTHQIINNDLGPEITAEAMQLSLQLLHQPPIFTACGLYRLDYVLLLQGTHSVTTFLVILLQFVTD